MARGWHRRRVRSRRALGSLSAAALAAVLVAVVAPDGEAHPFGSNHGAVAQGSKSSIDPTVVNDADGLFVRATTASLDVPLSTGSPGVFTNGAEVVGHNTRPMQLAATYPEDIVGEFYAVGYTAGCGKAGIGPERCTGIHWNGGVYKRWYTDGVLCLLDCAYGYWQFDAISSGAVHTYQLQRNWDPYNFRFIWRAWFDGEVKQVIQHLAMERGKLALGMESATREDHDHQPLNMQQLDYRDIAYHRLGDPSSSPPGTTNYRLLTWAQPSNPHFADCRIDLTTTSSPEGPVLVSLEGSGRC